MRKSFSSTDTLHYIYIEDMGVFGQAIPCCMVVCGIWQVKTKVVFLDGLLLRSPRFIILLAVS